MSDLAEGGRVTFGWASYSLQGAGLDAGSTKLLSY